MAVKVVRCFSSSRVAHFYSVSGGNFLGGHTEQRHSMCHYVCRSNCCCCLVQAFGPYTRIFSIYKFVKNVRCQLRLSANNGFYLVLCTYIYLFNPIISYYYHFSTITNIKRIRKLTHTMKIVIAVSKQ